MPLGVLSGAPPHRHPWARRAPPGRAGRPSAWTSPAASTGLSRLLRPADRLVQRSWSAATPCDATASTTADRAVHAVSPSAHDAGRRLRGDPRRGRPLQAHPYLVTAAPCRDAGGAARVVVLHKPFKACGARGLAGAGRSRGRGGARSLRLSPPDPAHPLSPGSARWDQFGAAPRSVQGDSRAPAAGPLPAPRDPGGRHRPTPHRAPWSRSSRLARDP